jgi:hypothetical protein
VIGVTRDIKFGEEGDLNPGFSGTLARESLVEVAALCRPGDPMFFHPCD